MNLLLQPRYVNWHSYRLIIWLIFLLLIAYVRPEVKAESNDACYNLPAITSKSFLNLEGEEGAVPWQEQYIPIGRLELKNAEIEPSTLNILSDYDLTSIAVMSWKDNNKKPIFDFSVGEGSNLDANEWCFGCAQSFDGQIIIKNADKESKKWMEYGRIKSLCVSINRRPIAHIILSDTSEWQWIDLSPFFADERLQKRLDKKSLHYGDILQFKILDIYKGKYEKTIAIAEWLGGEGVP